MKILVGLLLFCVLLAATSLLHKPFLKPFIEQDLLNKTKDVIRNAGHDPSEISVDGHYLDIPEPLASQISSETYDELETVIGVYLKQPENTGQKNKPVLADKTKAAGAAAGAAAIAATTPPVAPAKPVEKAVPLEELDFRADRKGGKIIATGLLPDTATQTSLISMLKSNAKGLPVEDRTKIAKNPTPDFWWKGQPAKFVPNLFNGSEGDAFAHYMPKDFKASGNFPQENPHKTSLNSLASLPKDVKQDTNLAYTPPVEDVDYRVERKDGKIIATGLLPNKRTQKNLLDTLKKNKAGLPVIDQTSIAKNPNPENWWTGKPNNIVPNFLDGSKGPAYMHFLPNDFKASAEFPDQPTHDGTVALTAGFPKDLKKDVKFTVAAPAPAPAPAPVVAEKPEAKVAEAPVEEKAPEPTLKDPEFFLTESKDGSLVIRGTVNSDGAKAGLVKAVKASIPQNQKISVTDNVKVVADRAPIQDFPSVQNLVTTHIQKAEEAEMDYTPKTLRLRGVLDTTAEEASLLTLAKPTLTTERPLSNELKVIPREPLDYRAERKDGKIIVTGLLPSKAVQSELVNLTKKNAGGLEVIDQTRVSSRPVKEYWWTKHPETALGKVFPKSQGPAYIHYKPNSLEAQADYPVKADQTTAQSQFSPVIQGINKKLNLTHSPAAPVAKPGAPKEPTSEEAVALEKDLQLYPVYFNTSSSYINTEEVPKIQKAADAILKSSAKNIGLTVGGYADKRGNAEFNKNLSLQRANAVRDRLIKLGVKADRLTVNHFGEDTSNLDKKDLWKARRVAISLTPID